MNIEIIHADLSRAEHAEAMVMLLDVYARDPMGGGKGLSEAVKQALPLRLHALPHAITLLAYQGDKAVGLLNAFEGFSTFRGKPLLNIHDIAVLPEHRGQGIATQLFRHIEEIAVERGCCKLTLEVLEGNQVAQSVYRRLGFAGYELDPHKGKALFWEKYLGD